MVFQDEFERYWMLKDARDEGHEEGREEGRVEGREEEKVVTALNLLAEGVPADVIARSTKLPLEQVIALSKG